MWRGIPIPRRMLFAIGFVSLFVSGGLSGPFPGAAGARYPSARHLLRARPFSSDHGCSRHFRYLCGDFYWFPKMFGRMMNEKLARMHFFLHADRHLRDLHADALSGFGGIAPALLAAHRSCLSASPDWPVNTFMTIRGDHHRRRSADLSVNLFWSMFKGRRPATIPGRQRLWSGPPQLRLRTTISADYTPVVHNGPYEYSVPGAPRDYVMQTDPATCAH
jgi:cytochrome c oxidase subunit I